MKIEGQNEENEKAEDAEKFIYDDVGAGADTVQLAAEERESADEVTKSDESDMRSKNGILRLNDGALKPAESEPETYEEKKYKQENSAFNECAKSKKVRLLEYLTSKGSISN